MAEETKQPTAEPEQVTFTEADIASLQEYLMKSDELKKREPPFINSELWDKVWDIIKETGEIPEEYKDRIAESETISYYEIIDGNKLHYIPEGKLVKGYIDLKWETWHKESMELEEQYHEIIKKVIVYSLQNPETPDILIKEKTPFINTDALLHKFIESKLSNAPAIISSVIPLYHVMANNSLINELTSKEAINAGEFDLTVINQKGKRKEITAYTIASCDQDKDKAGQLIKSKLTEYERQVSDAVISIWVETQKNGLPPEFTTDMVFRAMPGSGDKPSPQQAGAITRALDKLRNLHIYLDVTEEMKVRGIISDKEKLVYDDKYLSAARVTRTVKNGGQTVTAYHLHTEPLILSYCKLTNQLITVSPKWLEVKKIKGGKVTKESMAMTQERQAITGYLIRRIAIMRHDKQNKKPTQSNTILFTSLFDDIGLSNPDKQKAADTRKFCFNVLDYYKANNLISDYQKQTKGRSITGIVICL